MSGYDETLREHARLAILRFLEAAPQYTSNVSMLAELLPSVGIGFSRSQVVTEAHWLEEQGLADCEEARGDFLIVTATGRGLEVAQGLARVPGVKRPRPGV